MSEINLCIVTEAPLVNSVVLRSFSDQYLNEFLEDGGVLILLEILSQSQIKEEEKLDVLRLLLTVSNAGRGYKEVICENHGKNYLLPS